jgi:WD40 repeat protein
MKRSLIVLLLFALHASMVRSQSVGSTNAHINAVAKQTATLSESWAGSIGFNPDNTQIAVSGDFSVRDVHIWSWPQPSHLVRSLQRSGPAGSLEPLSFSANGVFLAVAQVPSGEKGDVAVRIWNSHTGELVHDVTQQEPGATVSIAFTPDGKFFARTRSMVRGSLGDRFIIYRTDTWQVVWGLHPTAENARSFDEPFSSIGQMAISADGQFAALGTKRYEGPPGGPVLGLPMILIVDLSARKVVRTIDNALPLENVVESIGWSSGGHHVAIGATVGGSFPGPDAVRVFDVATGTQTAGIRGAEAAVRGITYTPDGKYLVAAVIEGSVRIYDARDYSLLQAIPVDADRVAVSSDSRYLAIAARSKGFANRVVSVWELR